MLNKIFLQGRLVADPELKNTQNGTAVTSFRIAVDRDYKNQNGDRETDFINIVAWRGTAEFISKYFSKGRMIVVDGRLQIREYTDRDGNRRYVSEVLVSNAYFGDSRRDEHSSQYGGNDSRNWNEPADAGAAPNASGFAELSDDDGELPF